MKANSRNSEFRNMSSVIFSRMRLGVSVVDKCAGSLGASSYIPLLPERKPAGGE